MNGEKIDELEGGKVTPDHPKTKWWWCWWGWGGGAAIKHYSTSDKKINIRCNSSTLNIMNLFPKKCGGKKPPKKQKGGGK